MDGGVCAMHNSGGGGGKSMAIARQQIPRERRQYNQWVANETLEDYALRFTANKARKWSILQVANTALGTVAFLVLEAVGATITLNYGFTNAAAAILVVGAIIFALGLPVSYYAAKYGVDIDLLTRGAGFGYIGSTITSLIYASFTFIFFALEAAIMSLALEMCFGLPLARGLPLKRDRGHTARDLRLHIPQPVPILDPDPVGRAAAPALHLYRRARRALPGAVDVVCRTAGSG